MITSSTSSPSSPLVGVCGCVRVCVSPRGMVVWELLLLLLSPSASGASIRAAAESVVTCLLGRGGEEEVGCVCVSDCALWSSLVGERGCCGCCSGVGVGVVMVETGATAGIEGEGEGVAPLSSSCSMVVVVLVVFASEGGGGGGVGVTVTVSCAGGGGAAAVGVGVGVMAVVVPVEMGLLPPPPLFLFFLFLPFAIF